MKIHLKGSKELFIGCFYMHHRNEYDLQQLDSSLDKLDKSKYKHIILCGDFNCPDIDWETNSVHEKPSQGQGPIQQQLVDIALDHNLTQLNTYPTRHNKYARSVFYHK